MKQLFSIFTVLIGFGLFMLACESEQKPVASADQKIQDKQDEVFNLLSSRSYDKISDSLFELAQKDSTSRDYALGLFFQGLHLRQIRDVKNAYDTFKLFYEHPASLLYYKLRYRTITYIYDLLTVIHDRDQFNYWLEEGEKLEKVIADSGLIMNHGVSKAYVLKMLLQYQEALELISSVIASLEKKPEENKECLARAYNSKSLILTDLKRFEESIDYLNKAINLDFDRTYSNEKLSKNYNNIAINYTQMELFDKAVEYITKAIAENSKSMDQFSLVINYYNLGDNHLKNNDYKNAKAAFLKGQELAEKLDFDIGMAHNSVGLGICYLELNEIKKAKPYLEYAERIFRATKSYAMLHYVLEAKIKLETLFSDGTVNYATLNDYIDLERKYHDEVINEKTEELKIKYQVKETDLENTILKQDLAFNEKINKQQSYFIWLLFIITAILIYFFISTFQSNKKLQQLYKLSGEQMIEIDEKNEHLSQLIEERDALVRTIVHDLRNPISSMKGYINLLENETQTNEKELYTEMINASIRHLDFSVNSLLQAYTDDSSNSNISYVETKVHDFLNNIAKGFEFDAKTKGINIINKISDFSTHINRDGVYSIFGNLLSNAIKFSPRNTEIEVFTELKEDEWILRIKDQGPGFNDDDKRKMFFMFTPLSAVPNYNELSTGLGLYSVKKTIHRLGGKIVLNENYNEGAEFIVTIPVPK